MLNMLRQSQICVERLRKLHIVQNQNGFGMFVNPEISFHIMASREKVRHARLINKQRLEVSWLNLLTICKCIDVAPSLM